MMAVRNLVSILFLLLLFHPARAMVLEGQVRLDPAWEPVLYLSLIEDIDDLHTASYQFLIAEIRLDSTGNFRVEINGLPGPDHIYRLHVCQKGDPVSTIIIGGKQENFIHFIGNARANVAIHQPPRGGMYRDLVVNGVAANASFQQLLDWRRQMRGTARISSEQNELRLRRDFENRFAQMADTSANSLVRFCALKFLEEIAEEPPLQLYQRLESELSQGDTSPYASHFRERAAFLAFQAGDSGKRFIRFQTGIVVGLLAFLLFSAVVYFNHRQIGDGLVEAGKDGVDLSDLSAQEIRVWELLRQRKSNKEIAAELNVEVTTVKSHVYRIFSKLGIRSRREAWISVAEADQAK